MIYGKKLLEKAGSDKINRTWVPMGTERNEYKMATTRKGGSADKFFNLILTVVMVAVIGLSVYAIYSTMSERIIENQIANGERETDLAHMAEDKALTVDEFLEQYGLADAGLSEKSTQTEVLDKMTLTKYAEFAGTTVDEVIAQAFLEDKANGDTLYADFKEMFTVKSMMGGDEEQFKQLKEMYGLDDTITMDTLWSEVEPVLEEKAKEMQENAAQATAAPEAEGEATQEPEATQAAE